jgi:MFS transporter, FHS family, glucose/mannose:H+ symporter
MSDAVAGALFSAQFAGTLTATSFSSLIAGRLGAARALAIGFLLLALGIGALGAVPASLAFAVTVAYGLGLGLVLPLTNNVVAALAGGRAASALSLVNVAWGIGAMIWPLVVRAAMPVNAAAATTLLAACALLMAAVWGAGHFAADSATVPPARFADSASAGRRYPLAALYGTLILLYVGSEAAISGWATEFARRMPSDGALWTYAATAFWGAQTAGRLVAPVTIRWIGESRLLGSSLVLGCVATLAMVGLVSSAAQVILVAAITGFALAPVFPLLWARVIHEIAPVWPAAVGPLFAAGGIGGAVLPWLVGVVSSGSSLAAGLLVPLTSLGLMVLLLSFVRKARGLVI